MPGHNIDIRIFFAHDYTMDTCSQVEDDYLPFGALSSDFRETTGKPRFRFSTGGSARPRHKPAQPHPPAQPFSAVKCSL